MGQSLRSKEDRIVPQELIDAINRPHQPGFLLMLREGEIAKQIELDMLCWRDPGEIHPCFPVLVPRLIDFSQECQTLRCAQGDRRWGPFAALRVTGGGDPSLRSG